MLPMQCYADMCCLDAREYYRIVDDGEQPLAPHTSHLPPDPSRELQLQSELRPPDTCTMKLC
jgi:hypothetical protein